jgi:hypothetical protein
MLARSKSDQTSMLKAIATGNITIFKSYLLILEFCLQNKILTSKLLSFLMSKVDHAGFTPFFQALTIANIEILSVYQELLVTLLQNNLLSTAEFRLLVTTHNQADFSPLYQAILSKNMNILNLHLSILTLEHEGNKLFTPDELENIIHYKSKGLNVLHQVCTTGEFAIVEAMVNFIQQICPEKASTIITKLMQQSGEDGSIAEGRTPEVESEVCNALSINMYLTSFINLIPYKYNSYLHFHAPQYIDASTNPQNHRSKPLSKYPQSYILSSLDPSDQNRLYGQWHSFYSTSESGNTQENIRYHPYKRTR